VEAECPGTGTGSAAALMNPGLVGPGFGLCYLRKFWQLNGLFFGIRD
jgi:hypothetical protein